MFSQHPVARDRCSTIQWTKLERWKVVKATTDENERIRGEWHSCFSIFMLIHINTCCTSVQSSCSTVTFVSTTLLRLLYVSVIYKYGFCCKEMAFMWNISVQVFSNSSTESDYTWIKYVSKLVHERDANLKLLPLLQNSPWVVNPPKPPQIKK